MLSHSTLKNTLLRYALSSCRRSFCRIKNPKKNNIFKSKNTIIFFFNKNKSHIQNIILMRVFSVINYTLTQPVAQIADKYIFILYIYCAWIMYMDKYPKFFSIENPLRNLNMLCTRIVYQITQSGYLGSTYTLMLIYNKIKILG